MHIKTATVITIFCLNFRLVIVSMVIDREEGQDKGEAAGRAKGAVGTRSVHGFPLIICCYKFFATIDDCFPLCILLRLYGV